MGHTLEDEKENSRSREQHRSWTLGAGKDLGALWSIRAASVKDWWHGSLNPRLRGPVLGVSPLQAVGCCPQPRHSPGRVLLSPAGRRALTFASQNWSVG